MRLLTVFLRSKKEHKSKEKLDSNIKEDPPLIKEKGRESFLGLIIIRFLFDICVAHVPSVS